jgi:hypothetical protein
LTAFWAMVTLGRVGFASARRWVTPRTAYRLLPLLLAVAFILVARLPAGAGGLAIAAFALTGVGCSALLPLTISLAEQELTRVAAAVTGGVIAAYQFGYGLAAFGIGPLHGAGVTLATCYALAAAVAVVMAGLAWLLTPRHAA